MKRTVEQLRADLERARAKRRELQDEAQSIHDRAGGGDLDSGQAERFENVQTGIRRLDDEIADLDARWKEGMERRAQVARIGANPANLESGDGAGTADRGAPNTGSVRDAAMRVLERLHEHGNVPDHAVERAQQLVNTGRARERSIASQWVTLAGDEHYERAFAAVVGDPVKGHLLWSRDEQDAFRRVEEFRSMSLIGSEGGFMVPLTLDPSILLTSDGSLNPLRRIARVVRISTDEWHGVNSAGVVAEWLGEGDEVADGTPTLAQPTVPVHKGSAFVPYSFEVGQDAVDLTGELRPLLNDAADQLQAEGFTTGSGTGEPTGIVTALAGTASEVPSAGTDTLAAADVYGLIESVPPRFRPRSRWLSNLSIINIIDQFETTNGNRLFPELKENMLLRRPIDENSNMDGSITATEENYVLLAGDFQHFVIADRIGSTVELIPNLFGANRRPTGQRGLFLWFRTGSNVVVENSFRLLNAT